MDPLLLALPPRGVAARAVRVFAAVDRPRPARLGRNTQDGSRERGPRGGATLSTTRRAPVKPVSADPVVAATGTPPPRGAFVPAGQAGTVQRPRTPPPRPMSSAGGWGKKTVWGGGLAAVTRPLLLVPRPGGEQAVAGWW